MISEFNRLSCDKIKVRNQANNTTLHLWNNKAIDAILTFEKTDNGEIINRYAVLNVSRNF